MGGRVEEIIISCIFGKVGFLIFLDSLHRLKFLLSIFSYLLYFPIIIWKFPVASDIVKIPHLGSILIYIVEHFDEVNLIH